MFNRFLSSFGRRKIYLSWLFLLAYVGKIFVGHRLSPFCVFTLFFRLPDQLFSLLAYYERVE